MKHYILILLILVITGCVFSQDWLEEINSIDTEVFKDYKGYVNKDFDEDGNSEIYLCYYHFILNTASFYQLSSSGILLSETSINLEGTGLNNWNIINVQDTFYILINSNMNNSISTELYRWDTGEHLNTLNNTSNTSMQSYLFEYNSIPYCFLVREKKIEENESTNQYLTGYVYKIPSFTIVDSINEYIGFDGWGDDGIMYSINIEIEEIKGYSLDIPVIQVGITTIKRENSPGFSSHICQTSELYSFVFIENNLLSMSASENIGIQIQYVGNKVFCAGIRNESDVFYMPSTTFSCRSYTIKYGALNLIQPTNYLSYISGNSCEDDYTSSYSNYPSNMTYFICHDEYPGSVKALVQYNEKNGSIESGFTYQSILRAYSSNFTAINWENITDESITITNSLIFFDSSGNDYFLIYYILGDEYRFRIIAAASGEVINNGNSQVKPVDILYVKDNTYWILSEDDDNYRLIIHQVSPSIEISKTNNISRNTQHLLSNYPNPFNPTTTISFDLAGQNQVNLDIYNTKGQLVRNLISSQVYNHGSHKVIWDGKNNKGSDLGSGVYLYRLKTNNNEAASKMVLLK